MNIRILARVITYDVDENKILLVKNRDMDFWYAPGGRWEHEKENILEAASREVEEETGLKTEITRLLYVQEFHDTKDTIFFETFWLGNPKEHTTLNELHIDLDPNGKVEKAKWFSREEMQELKVFPKRLKNSFWDNVEKLPDIEDPFIGVS